MEMNLDDIAMVSLIERHVSCERCERARARDEGALRG
jgi:hypothetical protein